MKADKNEFADSYWMEFKARYKDKEGTYTHITKGNAKWAQFTILSFYLYLT